MSQQPLDLTQIAQSDRYNVDVKMEDPVVRDHRLREAAADAEAARRREDANATIQRRKDVSIFILVAIGVVAIAIFCIVVIASTGYTQDEKKWAMGIISAIISGFLGYMIGKK